MATLFDNRIALAEASMIGLGHELWTPDIGIRADEVDAFVKPFPAQYLAALRVCALMFTATQKRVWVHLAAEMQAGKTGVIATVARLILANYKTLGVTPDRIFVVTGMSDDAWQEQTAERMPYVLRENVHHGAGLAKVAAKLKHLARGDHLKNIVVFIDESHFATAGNNQPAKQVYETIALLCPRDKWAENNIRFMTISATDPAKVIAINAADVPAAPVVSLFTTEEYQSVEKLKNADRIRFLDRVETNGSLHTPTGFAALVSAVDELEAAHGPLIHIVRPAVGKGAEVVKQLESRYPTAVINQWDVASNKKKMRAAKESASTVSATNINDAVLNNAPTVTTFVVLKDMFRAAKTLNDKYVGVMYDRIGISDATNLQSLLGRACGYGKSNRTIIFTSQNTVTNYIKCWKEMCAGKDWESAYDDDVSKLNDKMPYTKAVKLATGETKLVTSATHATPMGYGEGGAVPADLAEPRATHDDDDYEVVWSEEEFTSVEALKASGLISGKMPSPREDGFFKDMTGNKNKKPMTRAKLMMLKAGKKTAHMRGTLEPGKSSKRTFPFYEDPSDPTTVRFVVRTITRKP